MKTVLILCGGALCLSALHVQAQDSTTDPAPATSVAATPDTTINSEGPGMSTNSMSGGGAMPQAKTRADVYQELVRSQRSGEAARLQDLFKGGN